MLKKVNLLTQKENEYLESPDYKNDFPGLSESLTDPKFKLSQLGVAPRDATYWGSKGVLPDLLGEGSMRKYTIIQSVYLRLVIQLRTLGVSIETIKRFKEKLFDAKIEVKDLVKTEKFNQVIEKIAEAENNSEEIIAYLSSDEFKDKIQGQNLYLFDLYVLHVIVFKGSVSLIVNEKGEFIPYMVTMHDKLLADNPDYKSFLQSPHYSLSVSEAYSGLVKDWKQEDFFEDISIVSKTEKRILIALREPGLKSVTIKFKDGEMDLLEKVKESKVDLGSRFMDVICKNGYQTVTIKTRAGKIVNYENKVLEKM